MHAHMRTYTRAPARRKRLHARTRTLLHMPASTHTCCNRLILSRTPYTHTPTHTHTHTYSKPQAIASMVLLVVLVSYIGADFRPANGLPTPITATQWGMYYVFSSPRGTFLFPSYAARALFSSCTRMIFLTVCARIPMHAHVRRHARTHARMHTRKNSHAHGRTHSYTHTGTRTHTHTHAHTHTHNMTHTHRAQLQRLLVTPQHARRHRGLVFLQRGHVAARVGLKELQVCRIRARAVYLGVVGSQLVTSSMPVCEKRAGDATSRVRSLS